MKKGEETARAKKQDERRDEASTRMRHGLRDLGYHICYSTHNTRRIRSSKITFCQLFNIILYFRVEEVNSELNL